MLEQKKERMLRLCNAMGASGEEKAVRNIMLEVFEKENILQDRLGSLFCVHSSPNAKAKLMIATSLDEEALMIDGITSDGFLSFVALESLSPASLLHQRVRVYNRQHRAFYGTIVSLKTRFGESAEATISMNDLVIDCGMTFAEASKNITIGDLVIYGNETIWLNEKVCMGKALRHRVMIEVILEIYERIQSKQYDFDVILGGVAQSVIGYRGTTTATYVVEPDCAFVLTGFESIKSSPKISLGDGVLVGCYDKQMLPSYALLEDFSQRFPSTKKTFGFAGNDGSFIHKTLRGTPTLSFGVAMNGIATNNSTCNIDDIDALVECIIQYLDTLDSDKILAFGFEAHR